MPSDHDKKEMQQTVAMMVTALAIIAVVWVIRASMPAENPFGDVDVRIYTDSGEYVDLNLSDRKNQTNGVAENQSAGENDTDEPHIPKLKVTVVPEYIYLGDSAVITVLDSLNDPVAKKNVKWAGENYLTDSYGKVYLYDMQQGDYRLEASHEGHQNFSQTYSVSSKTYAVSRDRSVRLSNSQRVALFNDGYAVLRVYYSDTDSNSIRMLPIIEPIVDELRPCISYERLLVWSHYAEAESVMGEGALTSFELPFIAIEGDYDKMYLTGMIREKMLRDVLRKASSMCRGEA